VQSVILTAGGLLILGVIIVKLPGGLSQLFSVVFSVASADGKFMLGDLDLADGKLHPASRGLALSHKTVLVRVGVFQWLGEYTTNQEVVQKYCAARSITGARQAMWISCWTCVPTWGYVLSLGTGLYVFYKVFPDPQVAEMLSGGRKAKEVLPHFVSTQLPAGLSGIVVATVLAAAGFARVLESRFESYYTGLASNLVMFVIGFALAIFLPARPRDLRNLTLWTLDKQPFD
jgi:solute:Na+ symporter, SSS family